MIRTCFFINSYVCSFLLRFCCTEESKELGKVCLGLDPALLSPSILVSASMHTCIYPFLKITVSVYIIQPVPSATGTHWAGGKCIIHNSCYFFASFCIDHPKSSFSVPCPRAHFIQRVSLCCLQNIWGKAHLVETKHLKNWLLSKDKLQFCLYVLQCINKKRINQVRPSVILIYWLLIHSFSVVFNICSQRQPRLELALSEIKFRCPPEITFSWFLR